MPDRQQMKLVGGNVEGVNDPIIANAEPESLAAYESVMRKLSELPPHVLKLRLNSIPQRFGKFKQRCVKRRIINMRCRAHLRFAYTRTNALLHFLFRLPNLSFEFRRKLQFIFDQIFEIIAHPAHVLDGKLANIRLNLLNRSHYITMSPCRLSRKRF